MKQQLKQSYEAGLAEAHCYSKQHKFEEWYQQWDSNRQKVQQTKYRANNQDESELIQQQLFRFNCRWFGDKEPRIHHTGYCFLFVDHDNRITHGILEASFENPGRIEMTLEQLREL